MYNVFRFPSSRPISRYTFHLTFQGSSNFSARWIPRSRIGHTRARPCACACACIHIHAVEGGEGQHHGPRPVYEFSIKPRISTENRFGPRASGEDSLTRFAESSRARGRARSVFASNRPARCQSRSIHFKDPTDTPHCLWLVILIAPHLRI